AAEESVDGFFEIEQPEGQAKIARVQHLRLVAKAAAIFVMRIDEEDSKVRTCREHLLQDDSNAAGFADARRSKNGKMFVEQFIDVDRCIDLRRLPQRTDLHRITRIAIDDTQLIIRHEKRRIADGWVFGDAAREARRAFDFLNLAKQIDV